MKFGRQLIRNFRHASRAPATTETSVVLRGGTDRDSRGCEMCGGQGKKTQVSESGFHVVVLLRIRNPTLSLSGWLGGNLSRIDHIKKIVFPSASMPGRVPRSVGDEKSFSNIPQKFPSVTSMSSFYQLITFTGTLT
jgi:hypothetical protein